MNTIFLNNERIGIMDLSAVEDVAGLPVVLQPKGHKGSSRECLEAVLEHPNVITMLDAKWVSVGALGEHAVLEPKAEAAEVKEAAERAAREAAEVAATEAAMRDAAATAAAAEAEAAASVVEPAPAAEEVVVEAVEVVEEPAVSETPAPSSNKNKNKFNR